MPLLTVNNLKKVYTTRFGGNKVTALKNINFSVEKGEYVAIREMRKHIGWYFKGIPHATEIRRVINTLEKKDEVIMLLEKYLHKAQN